VRRAAEALVEAGMDVDVICLRDISEQKKEIVNGVEVHRLPLQRQRGGQFRYLWEYFYFFILAFFFLTYLHLHNRYKIVHIHNMPDFLVFSSLLPRILGSRVILDLHDPMPEVFMTKYSLSASHFFVRVLLIFEKLSIQYSDLILTPNTAFRELFISRSCPEAKIKIVMNTPDEKIFFIAPNSNKSKELHKDNFSIMYHGTIVKHHGLDVALEALYNVRIKIPNVTFHVYGEGDFVGAFLKLVKELELNDIVFYHGHIPLEFIAKAIEFIDVGLIPNIRTPFTELNLPTRIFEYLSMKKPVIAPRTKGVLDYFSDKSIYFFEPGKRDSLKEVIFDVYNNHSKRQDLFNRGIAVYYAHRWELQKQRFVELVKNLLGVEA
jgi:glycosyltransferase involved in cell wall biosynthesis